jgi:hypothetical protein
LAERRKGKTKQQQTETIQANTIKLHFKYCELSEGLK